jgi:TrmH family RNA methyltransferase
VHVVDDELVAELGSLGHPGARDLRVQGRGPARPRRRDGRPGRHLHRVIDPGNVGTVVRAAGALGPAFLSLSAGCSDPLSAKGVRASMGAVFRVPIEHAELPEAGPARVALVAGAEVPLWQIDLRPPTVFVVGAERPRPARRDRCRLRAGGRGAAGRGCGLVERRLRSDRRPVRGRRQRSAPG